jgi:fermentation-respiration switch protein FrsA (DUF1100 family)
MAILPATRKKIGASVAAALGLYAVISLGAHLVAPSMLFRPELASRQEATGAVTIPLPDGARVQVLHLPNPSAAFTLWYFHGNAESLASIEARLHRLHDLGFAVFAAEYPGYGRSTGVPSEDSLYAAARAARGYLRGQLGVPAARTIAYGGSLGGGPAVQMATEERLGGLVLQSAFMSAYRVMTRWPLLAGDGFQNLGKMGRVACPVLVIHGRQDSVVPFYHGEALYAAANEPKRHLWVDAAGHNDLLSLAWEPFQEAMLQFSELGAQTGGAKP